MQVDSHETTTEYEAFDLDTKYRYLHQKLWQHTGSNVQKCVKYWMMLIKLPFDKAPAEYMDTFRAAKAYIKKELLL